MLTRSENCPRRDACVQNGKGLIHMKDLTDKDGILFLIIHNDTPFCCARSLAGEWIHGGWRPACLLQRSTVSGVNVLLCM